MSNVLIFCEQAQGTLKKASLPAIAAGQQLAKASGGQLHLVLVGPGAAQAAGQANAFGAAAVYTVEGPAFENYLAEPYSKAIAAAAKQAGAAWVGAASTAQGK